jgi:sec-independent protein translocase protein TatA
MEFSMTHMLILLVIALLVFGARRIPEIGSSLGQGIREFKKSLREVAGGVDDADQRPIQAPSATPTVPPASSGSGEPKRLSQ